jgi:hypothetical protein
MVVELWYLVALVALAGLVGWGLLVARRRMLAVVAVVLLAFSGFALHTLVLDEPYLDKDLNGRLDDLAIIGIPAVAGIVIGVLLVAKRAGRERLR